MKHITLSQMLTDDEIAKAVEIYQHDRAHFHQRILAEVIEPNMARINTALGQENDARYLAYCVEYAMIAYARRLNP